VARLATVTAEAGAHVVPCCFAILNGGTIVSAVDGKPKSTTALKRLANIEQHRNVSLVVDHYADDWSELWWVRVDGNARVIASGKNYELALDALANKYSQYRDHRPQGPVIAIEPLAWRSWESSPQSR